MTTSCDVLVFCGSLRKGSCNRAIANTLPELATDGMLFTDAATTAVYPLDLHAARPRDRLDALPLFEMVPPDLCNRLHNQHPWKRPQKREA